MEPPLMLKLKGKSRGSLFMTPETTEIALIQITTEVMLITYWIHLKQMEIEAIGVNSLLILSFQVLNGNFIGKCIPELLFGAMW